ncbi:hypothetical protein EV360DRAFT_82645 [Lentinula raphanica]|nr:hypothetical protein EV360DRAFT_82645 [Lentinula raphanica]
MVYTRSMFTALLAIGAASSVIVSAVPIDTNSGPSLVPTTTTSTHIPTSTSPTNAAIPKAPLDDPTIDFDDVPGVAPLSRSSDRVLHEHLQRRADPKGTDSKGANDQPPTGGGQAAPDPRSNTNRGPPPPGWPAGSVPPGDMTYAQYAEAQLKLLNEMKRQRDTMRAMGYEVVNGQFVPIGGQSASGSSSHGSSAEESRRRQ